MLDEYKNDIKDNNSSHRTDEVYKNKYIDKLTEEEKDNFIKYTRMGLSDFYVSKLLRAYPKIR